MQNRIDGMPGTFGNPILEKLNAFYARPIRDVFQAFVKAATADELNQADLTLRMRLTHLSMDEKEEINEWFFEYGLELTDSALKKENDTPMPQLGSVIVGLAYEYGLGGVSIDKRIAFHFYGRSSAHPTALYQRGRISQQDADGIVISEDDAFTHFIAGWESAANLFAYTELSPNFPHLVRPDFILPKNQRDAFEKAANGGCAEAYVALAEFVSSVDEQIACYEAALERGYVEALPFLTEKYAEKNTPEELAKAALFARYTIYYYSICKFSFSKKYHSLHSWIENYPFFKEENTKNLSVVYHFFCASYDTQLFGRHQITRLLNHAACENPTLLFSLTWQDSPHVYDLIWNHATYELKKKFALHADMAYRCLYNAGASKPALPAELIMSIFKFLPLLMPVLLDKSFMSFAKLNLLSNKAKWSRFFSEKSDEQEVFCEQATPRIRWSG